MNDIGARATRSDCWSAIQQIVDPGIWVGYLPTWTGYLPIPGEMFVMLNGWSELVLAALLAAGCFTRVISIVLGLHLPGIAWTAGGAVGVRDATLAVRLWALAAGKTDIWMLDASVAKK